MTNANFEFRDNSGQIVVGSDNNLQFVTYKVDGSLTICQSEEPPKVKLRKPISQYLSNPSSVPIGREAEIQRCISALKLSQQVEFYGSAGTGKSFLARYLACHPEISSLQHFSDGVIYLYWYKQQTVEDLPQRLFESFYESDRSFKPSLTEIESRLQDKQALVILDDINLSGEELKKLRRMLETLAPRCIFLFTSTERSLWGKGHSILIKGLSKENALSLVEKELGSLTSQERKMVEAIWAALGGNPLEILQQTARVHEGKETLEEVVHRVQLKPSFEQRTKELLNCLGKDQYQILEALAALEVSLLVGQVSVISSVSDARQILLELEEMQLVESDSSRYSLSSNLLGLFQKQDLKPYLERALSLFIEWAQEYNSRDNLSQEFDVIVEVLSWAVSTERWNEVLVLGRLVETAPVLSGQWGMWAQVLQWQLKAARKLGNQSSIARAQHQLGTRALCLGYVESSCNLLNQAIQLRESIGELNQAKISRDNLNISSQLERMMLRGKKVASAPFHPDSPQKYEPEEESIYHSIKQPQNPRSRQYQNLDIPRLIGVFTSLAVLVLTGIQIWKYISPQSSADKSIPEISLTPSVSPSSSPDKPSPTPPVSPSPSSDNPVLAPSVSPSLSPDKPSPTPSVSISSVSPSPDQPVPTLSVSPSPSPNLPATSSTPIVESSPIPSSSPNIPLASPPLPSPSVILASPPPPPAEPKLQLNAPPSLDFGLFSELQPNTKELWVKNIGTAPLSIYPITFDPSNGFQVFLNWDHCSNSTLPPSGECNITVEFAPRSSGSYLSTLIVASDGGNGSVVLKGRR